MGKMASDRSNWTKLIHESMESFENSRMQYSTYKRLIRKGEQGPTPRSAPALQSHHAVTYVENCAYLLLVSKAIGVNVQNLSCTINNVTASKIDRLCQFCGKICRSLACLKNHLRTHTILVGRRGGRS